MRDYVIATASTADLDISWLEEHQVPLISYFFNIGDNEYTDDCTSKTRAFVYEQMRQDKAVSTSAISTYRYYAFFSSLMKEGKDVIYVDMSRQMSSSINNAELAAKEIERDFPNQKLYMLDSYCITYNLALFIKQLVKRKEAGQSFDEVIAWGEAHKKEYIGRFMVEDLKWLRRGGRLSNASAMVGTLLNIKPIIYISEEGKLVAISKVHGRRKCLSTLVKTMVDDMDDNTANEEVAIIHADARSDAEKVKQMILETYPQIKHVTINELGPVIAAHVGPDFIAITYHGKKRVC